MRQYALRVAAADDVPAVAARGREQRPIRQHGHGVRPRLRSSVQVVLRIAVGARFGQASRPTSAANCSASSSFAAPNGCTARRRRKIAAVTLATDRRAHVLDGQRCRERPRDGLERSGQQHHGIAAPQVALQSLYGWRIETRKNLLGDEARGQRADSIRLEARRDTPCSS